MQDETHSENVAVATAKPLSHQKLTMFLSLYE